MKRKMSEIEIMFLPVVVPSNIDDDVSHLTFGKVLRVSELPHSDKIKFITDENQPVAHVTAGEERIGGNRSTTAAEAAAPAGPLDLPKRKTGIAEGRGESTALRAREG